MHRRHLASGFLAPRGVQWWWLAPARGHPGKGGSAIGLALEMKGEVPAQFGDRKQASSLAG